MATFMLSNIFHVEQHHLGFDKPSVVNGSMDDVWLSHFAHGITYDNIKTEHYSTAYDASSSTTDGMLSHLSDDTSWDPASLAAEIFLLQAKEVQAQSKAALVEIEPEGAESNSSQSLKSESSTGPAQVINVACKRARKGDQKGKQARRPWTQAEDARFLKALEKFGPPDVETHPVSGRISVRLGPV